MASFWGQLLFYFIVNLYVRILFSILTTFRSQDASTHFPLGERSGNEYFIDKVGRLTKMQPRFALVTHRGPPISPLYPCILKPTALFSQGCPSESTSL